MKRTLLSVLFLTLALGLSAFAGKRSTSTPAPTVVVECGLSCASDQPLHFTGTGYGRGVEIIVEIAGPSPQNVSVITNSSGNIDAWIVGVFLPGDYVASAYTKQGRKLVFTDSDLFTVIP